VLGERDKLITSEKGLTTSQLLAGAATKKK